MSDPRDEVRRLMGKPEDITPHPSDLPPPRPDNVTPLRPNRKPGRIAQDMLSRVRIAADMLPPTDVSYLIKGWLAPETLAVMFGPPGVGKSFLALDMVHRLARGEAWGGCRVRSAPVLYVTLEGGAAFERRVTALEGPRFHVLDFPVRFLDRQHPVCLAEVVEELAKREGRPFGLIVIDTLSRAMAGGDENTSEAMGRAIAAAELLKQRTGACVLLVHHIGKDRSLGARGHSSLKAAVDTEIEVWKGDDDDVIEAKAIKQRDLEVGRTFRYRLRQVELGRDSDGDAITTCVVERAAEGEEPRRASVKVEGKAKIALQALTTALERHGVKRQGPDFPADRNSVTRDQWREAAELHGMFDPDATAAAKRNAFKRAVDDLREKGLVETFDNSWWPT